MVFLSKENEALLKECIENDAVFPRILRNKFEGLSAQEDNHLREQIKALVDDGFFSKIQWGDNAPLFGRIEQKGYDYFKQRDIYIRAKLRQDPFFVLLDEESEKVLSELLTYQDSRIFISGDIKLGRVYEGLCKRGYITLPNEGLSYDFNGEFAGFTTITQAGCNYFVDKENRIEEILVLGDEASKVTKVDRQYNISGNTFSDSPIQIGDYSTQNVNSKEYDDVLNELRSQIEMLKIATEQTEQLNSLIDKAQEFSSNNDRGGVKKVLAELWELAKQIGSPLLVAYLSTKLGLGQ